MDRKPFGQRISCIWECCWHKLSFPRVFPLRCRNDQRIGPGRDGLLQRKDGEGEVRAVRARGGQPRDEFISRVSLF